MQLLDTVQTFRSFSTTLLKGIEVRLMRHSVSILEMRILCAGISANEGLFTFVPDHGTFITDRNSPCQIEAESIDWKVLQSADSTKPWVVPGRNDCCP